MPSGTVRYTTRIELTGRGQRTRVWDLYKAPSKRNSVAWPYIQSTGTGAPICTSGFRETKIGVPVGMTLKERPSWVESEKTDWTDQYLKWNEPNLQPQWSLGPGAGSILETVVYFPPNSVLFKASVPGRTTMSTTCNRLVLFNASTVTLGTWPVEVPWDSTSEFADWWECKPQFAKEVSK